MFKQYYIYIYIILCYIVFVCCLCATLLYSSMVCFILPYFKFMIYSAMMIYGIPFCFIMLYIYIYCLIYYVMFCLN